jgi:hypothetical protein
MNVACEQAEETASRIAGLWRFGLALLLAGGLLVAHGCHGDEDNELFGAVAAPPWARSPDGGPSGAPPSLP